MLLWLIFALMVAAAVWCLVWPLGVRKRPVTLRDADVSACRVQLKRLEEDRFHDVIAETEAFLAEAELSRRLLLAADHTSPERFAVLAVSRFRASFLVFLFVFGSLGVYLLHGSPGLLQIPVSVPLRMPGPDTVDLNSMIVRVETYLASNPDEGQGWDVIAPVYMRLKRYRDAAHAFANAVRLRGATARRLSGLGEALTLEQGGIVPPDARKIFLEASKRDPALVMPRFYLALSLKQSGAVEEALKVWKNLEAEAPPDAPWLPLISAYIAFASSSPRDQDGEKGPTGILTMSPQDLLFVEGMVSRLALRLDEYGKDLAGWMKLIHSYVVLDRRDEASAALRRARRHFSAQESSLARLSKLAEDTGLEAETGSEAKDE
ncbi:MAG: c-type cytochrome biogenesis protein CcmI [Alphaproteobacteria bacterium]|nr:c-type cytochrome biogenesis protein CcmI [Alphaproteobacteria bacterium]